MPCRSIRRRRADSTRAREATRRATPCSQAATEPRVADRPSPAEQHQERGLEGILGVVRVVEQPATDPQHHRPVPLDQRLERQLGRLAITGRKPFEQLSIRQVADHAGTNRAPSERGTLNASPAMNRSPLPRTRPRRAANVVE